ncbi:MAG: chorismate synthase [Clostridia bacterium]|nr:chorismate synthase [Clostridia bacterium]
MESSFGKHIRVTVFGESHGACIGGRVENLPAGIPLDTDALMAFMRRRQGGGKMTTPRKEADLPIFTAGITNGVTDGSTLCFTIENQNTRSSDYDRFRDTPRPSHADYTALLRFGDECDIRGGGHFSGRLTAPVCVAGYFALAALAQQGISVGAHLYSVGGAADAPYDPVAVCPADFRNLEHFPARDACAAEKMMAEIAAAAAEGDSVGGIVECAVTGLPAGLGDPLYDGIENRLAATLFGLGGVRGVEFGTGFAAATMRGHLHNDPFVKKDGKIQTVTNHHGGVLGGISSGMPILLRVAFKPTASISMPQTTLSFKTGEQVTLSVTGRHDPCIAVRAVPCVEAQAALVLLDFLTEQR